MLDLWKEISKKKNTINEKEFMNFVAPRMHELKKKIVVYENKNDDLLLILGKKNLEIQRLKDLNGSIASLILEAHEILREVINPAILIKDNNRMIDFVTSPKVFQIRREYGKQSK